MVETLLGIAGNPVNAVHKGVANVPVDTHLDPVVLFIVLRSAFASHSL